MRNHARGLASAGVLCCGIWVLSGSAVFGDEEEDKQIKRAQQDVLALAKEIEGGKTDQAKLKAIRKKYEELQPLMYVFKPKSKLGVGFPPKGGAIELKIHELGKKALTAAELTAQRAALIKAGYVSLAMSEVTMHYAPAVPKGGKGAKEWKDYATEMKKASRELIAAVKQGNAAALKAAANNLGSACNSCHTDFR